MATSDRKLRNRQAIEQFIRALASSGREATALGEAARWWRLELVDELLGTVEVDARTESGAAALALAASAGHPEIVQRLIERGAEVNVVSERDGTTPLIACLGMPLQSKRVYIKICTMLLKAGATSTLEVRDKTGRTALDWAKEGRPEELLPLLEGRSTSGHTC